MFKNMVNNMFSKENKNPPEDKFVEKLFYSVDKVFFNIAKALG